MARRASDAVGQPRDLVRIRERLEEWRGIQARGVAFPEALCSAAGRVAQRRGVYLTARTLGLEYNKLKAASGGLIARATRKRTARSAPKSMKLVELTGMSPASPGGCRVSLQGLEG